jgi:amino-acid N-acetyltransferase
MIVCRKANPEDRDLLAALLLENGMEYVDPAQDYVLALDGTKIVGCARAEEHGEIALVRPVVVARTYRQQGLGRLLLKRVIPADKPTGLVARGESMVFYKALGFSKAKWKMIPESQQEECEECPDRKMCQPRPMILNRTLIKKKD